MGTSNSFGKNSYCKASNGISNYLNGLSSWQELDSKLQKDVVDSLIQNVKIIACRFKSKLPSTIELDDLISAGCVGLMEALRNFDGSHNVKLETFVENRIKGAILDELRRQDFLSRKVRQNVKLVENVKQKLEQSLGREPTIEEIAAKSGLSEIETQNCLDMMNTNLLINFDVVSHMLNNGEDNPETLLEKKEIISKISHHIAKLTEREQLVLSLYYVEELTMKEVAEVLNITEGRVSQLHSQAIKKLRKILGSKG